MTNNIYIYHHDDVDGIAAAAMINLAYPTATKKFIQSTYPFELDETPFRFMMDPDDVTVFIVDLSLSYDAFQKLLQSELMQKVKKVIWIDHHVTSINSMTRNHIPYPKNLDTYVKERSCGALLTYEYLHPDMTPPKFLGVIDIYDRHDGSPVNLKLATDLNLALLSVENLSPVSEIWTELMTGEDVTLQLQIATGGIIHNYLDEENKKLLSKCAVITKVLDMPCLMVNARGTSILFDSVDRKKYPLCLAWVHEGDKYKYTIYSDGSKDCSAIAATFGGGGHPGAAGFSSDQLLFLDQNCEKYLSD